MEFLFCRVNSSYCDFLRDKDKRVPQTMDDKRTRPFVGIVFSVNDKNYYVPLTSPKKKHSRMSNSSDFLKIEDGKYGAMNFNNMIPVPTECLEEVDILIHKGDSPDKIKYKTLCQRQYEWCKANHVQIVHRAVRLYNIVTTKKAYPALLQRCCDFQLCERRMEEYCRLYGLTQPKAKARDDRER